MAAGDLAAGRAVAANPAAQHLEALAFDALAGLLAGCSSARSIPQTARSAMAIYGDDIAAAARTIALNPALQTSDELARGAVSSLDDILRSKPAAQTIDDLAREFAQSADSLPRSSVPAGTTLPVPVALYQDASQLSSTQQGLIGSISQAQGISEAESLIELKTICWIADYVMLMGEYPPSDYGFFYVSVQFVLEQTEPEAVQAAEFAAQAYDTFISWLNDPAVEAPSAQERAEVLFQGVCLAGD